MKSVSAMQSADFQVALATRPCARTLHFSLYQSQRAAGHTKRKLSTPKTFGQDRPVDGGSRLGFIVAKRLAKRAVTRNLIKRQGRALFTTLPGVWAGKDWVVRQSRAFERQHFVSAKSGELRALVRAELEQLLASAMHSAEPVGGLP